jgi:site-specific DNA-methyltransferase (adenine-specific)
MIEPNTITCGDNLPLMKELPDNYCKLVVTSPSYNLGANNIYEKGKEAKYHKRSDDIKDDYFEWLKPRLAEMIRISEYVFFNVQMLAANKVDIIKLLYEFRNFYKDRMVWAKGFGQPSMEPGVLNSGFEDIFIFSRNRPDMRKFYGYEWRGTVPNLINFGTNRRNKYSKVHKAMFPESLPTFIIENFSKEGDIILDPFNGLGTSALAAKKLNRKYIGFDIDPEYCRLAEERVNGTNPQTS